MRHFDLTPLYKSTIGFDRVASLIDSGFDNDANGFPPYDIERLGDNKYRISMAVAGFSEDELDIELKENNLTIKGNKKADSEERNFLHRGIAARNFERRFKIADYVEVRTADLTNGLLNVDLVREITEAMKPRTIKIGKNDKEVPQLETADV